MYRYIMIYDIHIYVSIYRYIMIQIHICIYAECSFSQLICCCFIVCYYISFFKHDLYTVATLEASRQISPLDSCLCVFVACEWL